MIDPAIQKRAQALADQTSITDEEFVFLCENNPLWFMEHCLKIVPKSGGGMIPFVLNLEQMKIFKIIWAKWRAGEPIRIINLKARQLGISTLYEALGYWMTSTRAHTNGLVLSHEKDSARVILKMAGRFYDNDRRHDRKLCPTRSHANRDEITFDNPDFRDRPNRPGLDSHLRIATADNKSAGHSTTFQFFHGSETARWKHGDALIGVLNALSSGPGTMGFLESTAYGAHGIFYDTWRAASEGQNEWTPIFLSWKGRSEYSHAMTKKQKEIFANQLTYAEVQIMEKHDLSLEEMAWRRATIQGPKCMGQGMDPADVFRSQFPLTPEEAFVTSGRNYFDLGAIANMEARARVIPFMRGAIRVEGKKGMTAPSKIEWIENKGGFLRIWKGPKPGEDFVVGADVATGAGKDKSVAYAMNRRTGEFVACFRALIDPDRFADEIMSLAWYYNEACLAPEANSIGFAVAKRVSENYRRTIYYTKLDRTGFGQPDPLRPGWYTTPANRVQMYGLLRQAIRDGTVTIYDQDFFTESRDFVLPEKDGVIIENRPAAIRHKHDDHISAACITLWCNEPAISGPIRVPKATIGKDPDWRVQFMREDNAAEGQSMARYDDVTGDEL